MPKGQGIKQVLIISLHYPHSRESLYSLSGLLQWKNQNKKQGKRYRFELSPLPPQIFQFWKHSLNFPILSQPSSAQDSQQSFAPPERGGPRDRKGEGGNSRLTPPAFFTDTKRQLRKGRADLSFLNRGHYTPAAPRTKYYHREAHLVLPAGAPHLQVPQELGSVRLRLNGLILTDGQEQRLQAGSGVHRKPQVESPAASTTGQVPSTAFAALFLIFGPTPSLPEASGSGLPQEVPATALKDRRVWERSCGGKGGAGS